MIRYANNSQGAGLNEADPLDLADRAAYGGNVMEAEARDIASYLDYVWQQHHDETGAGVAHFPEAAPDPVGQSQDLRDSFVGPAPGFGCFHLIYAYLIENTRMYEIMGRVIDAFNAGEKLGVMTPNTRQWISVTEALFYRQQNAHDHGPLSTITSDARADGRAIRRNAYYRMFGMDLNHGTDDNKPYPYKKPDAANKTFVTLFEELLRQIWIANVNQLNIAGDETDDAQIQYLSEQLDIMMGNRRLQGTLSREEFSAVATMDWLRLALSFNSPVVVDLRAQAANEAERLKKIGERVGLPAHGKSDDYFALAGDTSALLCAIEAGAVFDAASYLAFVPDVLNVINHWARATGKVLKRLPRPVIPSATAA
ncbi:MAG: hypothetical protein OEZ11_15645 [Gammaproteobacteria bacterium]|nr:hypothetical protein [Gammaproteobacteria bacterium]